MRFIRVDYDGDFTPIEADDLTAARLAYPNAFTFRPAPPDNPGGYAIEHRPERVRTPGGGIALRPGVGDWCVILPDGQIESRWDTGETAQYHRNRLNRGEVLPNWTKRPLHAPEPVLDTNSSIFEPHRAARGKPANPSTAPSSAPTNTPTQGATPVTTREIKDQLAAMADQLDNRSGVVVGAIEAQETVQTNIQRARGSIDEIISVLGAAVDHGDQVSSALWSTAEELDTLSSQAAEALDGSNQSGADVVKELTQSSAVDARELFGRAAVINTSAREVLDQLTSVLEKADELLGRTQGVDDAIGTLLATIVRSAHGMHDLADAM